MGFKVGQKYRKNELSFKPGGYIVEVQMKNGRRFSYDKIKYPRRYIEIAKRNPEVDRAWINESSL